MMALYFLLWQLVIAIIAESQLVFHNETIHGEPPGKLGRQKRDSPPEELFLQINDGLERILNIHLKRTDQLLANVHLPIWTVRKIGNKPKFHAEQEVMKQISEFTMYHDIVTKSSVVYFHKTGHLDGVIDNRYYIRGLPINELTQEHNLNDKYIFERKESTESPPKFNSMFNKSTRDHLGMFGKRSIRSVDFESMSKVLQPDKNAVYYPELLVVISHDVFNSLRKKAVSLEEVRHLVMGRQKKLDLSDIVSYVLTFYNAVDMLYGLIESHKIKLNIAAIIIEVDEGAMDFVQSPLHIRTPLNDALFANPVLINLMTGFEKLDREFPVDSYDFIIYTTTLKLTKVCPGRNKKPVYYRGFTSSNLKKHPDQIHNFKHTSIIIRDDAQLQYFITAAHEIAHAMTVGHDPKMYTENGECASFIMTPSINRCPNCLKWSKNTEETLGRYFRSPAHCILRNYPRSLFPPGPKMMLTKEEQFQCSDPSSSCGLHIAKHYRRNIKKREYENICEISYRCLDDNFVRHTFKLMDGTPCGRKKVCWNQKCVHSIN